MTSAARSTKERCKQAQQIKYGTQRPNAPVTVMEQAIEYIAPCPKCDRRVLDVLEPPERKAKVRLKCPHCRRIVNIQIAAAL